MPPQPAPHLVGYLMEVGPTELTGMDRAPISWATLDCWCRMTGAIIAPWEARLLRRLSSDFLGESKRAEKPDCPPPWHSPGTAEARDAINAKLQSFFSSFGKGG